MTDAPKRIQVRWTKSGTGHVATPASAGLVANCAAQYLSTEALASSPEVAALIREAEARAEEAELFLDNAMSQAPEPLKALGKWLADMLDEDDWPTAERFLNAAVKACAEAAAIRRAEGEPT